MRRPTLVLGSIVIIAGLACWGIWASHDRSASAGGVTVATGDVNGDGMTNIGDAVYLLDYLFSGGSAPVEVPCGGAQDIPSGDDQFRMIAFQDLQDFAGSTLALDPASVQSLSFPQGLFVEAMRSDLADLTGPDDFFAGVDVGVIYISFEIPGPTGGAPIPPGFYRSRILFDPAIYATGSPNYARSFLVDASGAEHEIPTFTGHFSGSSPIGSLGVRSEICNETSHLSGKRYVSCPQLGDLLAMTCINSAYALP